MKSRTITNILLVVLLIFLGIILYQLLTPHTSTFFNPSSTDQTATTTSDVSNAQVTFNDKKINESDQTKKYEITVSYPELSGLADTAIQTKINQDIASLIKSDVSSFKTTDDGVEPGAGLQDESTFTITYEAKKPTMFPGVIGIMINEQFYSAGAAHPGSEYISLNYDLKSGRRINLADLFKNNSQYLQTISTASIKSLNKKMGDDAVEETINDGAGPSSDNFKVFLITDAGLDITFNEYQVAGYAAGSQDVLIAWKDLSLLLDPNGPVGSQAK